MSFLRNKCLSTSSFLLGPNDPPNGGDGQQDDAGGNDTNDDGDAGGENGLDNELTDAGAGGEGDDGDGDDGDDTGGDADDDDPDLADLPPEVRAKAKAAIEKRVARETGWRDRQLNKLHAKVRTAQEDVNAAGEIVGRRTAAPAAGDVPANLTAAQIEERAQALAKNMTAQQQYDQNANDADAKGVSAYGDKWKSTMAKLPRLGGVEINDMVDILNTDQPHVVLFSLADPDTYERVMALPPARRRNEFVKLSLKEAPKPKTVQRESKRPGDVTPPVTPINNGRRTAAAQVNLNDDKVSDDAWYAARNATRRKKFSSVD